MKQSLLRIERKLDDHKVVDHKEIEERLRAMEVWRGYYLVHPLYCSGCLSGQWLKEAVDQSVQAIGELWAMNFIADAVRR